MTDVWARSGASDAIEDPRMAGREAVVNALAGRTPDVRGICICFCSAELDLSAVLAGLRDALGADWEIVGCTTFSEATNRGYTEESVSVLLLGGAALRFGVGAAAGIATAPEAAVATAWDEARRALDTEPSVAWVLPDAALSMRAEDVVKAIAERAGRTPVAGGCPGDGARFREPHQLVRDRVVTDHALVVLFGPPLVGHVATRSGWIPVGEIGIATKSEGPRVHRIDDRPATDFVRRYVGEGALHPEVLGTMPLALVDESVARGDERLYVIRSPFFHDPETGSLQYAGCVPEGARVQLGHTSRDLVLASARDAARALVAGSKERAPLCVLMASCGGRKLMLGLDVEREAPVIVEQLPAETPLLGFYSYGEIGAFEAGQPGLDTLRYHNCTLVLMALGVAT